MACHHFGIIDEFDDFHDYGADGDYYGLVKKYNCVSYDDDALEMWARGLEDIEFHWHTHGNMGNGLAWWGVTLIPPDAIPKAIFILEQHIDKTLRCEAEAVTLLGLLKKALSDSKWVIHYGC